MLVILTPYFVLFIVWCFPWCVTVRRTMNSGLRIRTSTSEWSLVCFTSSYTFALILVRLLYSFSLSEPARVLCLHTKDHLYPLDMTCVTIKMRFGRRQSFAKSHICHFFLKYTHISHHFALGILPYLILGYSYHSAWFSTLKKIIIILSQFFRHCDIENLNTPLGVSLKGGILYKCHTTGQLMVVSGGARLKSWRDSHN